MIVPGFEHSIRNYFLEVEAADTDHISLSRPTSADRTSGADVDNGSTSSPAIRSGSALSGSIFSGKAVTKILP